MTATTTATIQGVSVHSRQKKRGTDVFELGLSPAGIEVRRPGRPVQQMAWNRVSEWEIEERKGYVLLTLRGRGATTPLVVPGWSLDDLEVLLRDVTSDALTYVPEGPAPRFDGVDENGTASNTASAAPTKASAAQPKPRQKSAPRKAAAAAPAAAAAAAPATSAPAAVTPVAAPAPSPSPSPSPAPAPAATPASAPRPPGRSRVARRQEAKQRRTLRSFPVPWKAVVTIALLGVLATAVTLVLLQSAGVISWGFLGPVA
ncbi:MAG TPA: hypothetical protein VG346_11420 [Acidimicrobiales bacterium]|nr:hypothetical protein [Acidimicrobiales bacterium]